MMTLWSGFLNWLSSIMPGWKTQITAWSALIAPGAILTVLEFLQATDLSALIPPTYYPIYMAVVGLLIVIFRASANRNK